MPAWSWWLIWLGMVLYAVPVAPTWFFLYNGSRPRRGRLRSWAVASFGATMWLPCLAWVWAGVRVAYTPEQRQWARRRYRQERAVDQLERELRDLRLR